MEKKSQEFSMQEALRLANSPAGRQLIELLRQSDPETIQSAVKQANAGNYTQAAQQLKTMLNTPQTKALLRQLEK